MVKNNPHSLRGSVSNLSLRTSASISAQETAAYQRIAELEAQVASLSTQAARSAPTTASSTSEPLPPAQDKTTNLLSGTHPFDGDVATDEKYEGTRLRPEPRGERLTLENVKALLRMREQRIAAEQHRLRGVPVPGAMEETNSDTSTHGYAQATPFLPFHPHPWFEASEGPELPEGTTLFEKFNEDMRRRLPKRSLITKGLVREAAEEFRLKSPEAYTKPFCDFLTENPTVWHAVNYFEKRLERAGFVKVLLFLLLSLKLISC
jgi:aminopeptidase I